MDINSIIYNIAVWALPVLFAITLHEAAHGWVANKLGDGTARMLGRLSLNPVKHIDPVGTIVVPLVMLVLQTGFIFGWAKPVPVNTRNFKNARKDMAIVAVAGPLSNFAMAIFWVFMLKISASLLGGSSLGQGFMEMAKAGIIINLILFVFNLLPIPPLDGGRVLSAFLPPTASDLLDKIEPYGFFIVIGLLYFGILNAILDPIISFFMSTFGSLLF